MMSKRYNSRLFKIFNQLNKDFQAGKLTEDQFTKLLGLAISKEFSKLVDSRIQESLPKQHNSVTSLISYNWKKYHNASI